MRLLTTMATSSPRLFSAESLRPAMLLAKLWALSALSTPRSGGMFRNDSRKQKNVSFRRNHLELPGHNVGIGLGDFGKHLQRTDSKDSSCSSLSSAPAPGSQHDLRPTLSVPAFHDHFNKFRRTDSESSGSSFASIGLSILSRGGSRKTGRNAVEGVVVDRAIERADSSQSFGSQGRKDSNEQIKRGDEVAIVVSNRKDSITNAVRRNSGEHQRPENMW